MTRHDLKFNGGKADLFPSDDGKWVLYEEADARIQELAKEYHDAINEPMYAGTRQDWIGRCYMAEERIERLLKAGEAETVEELLNVLENYV